MGAVRVPRVTLSVESGRAQGLYDMLIRALVVGAAAAGSQRRGGQRQAARTCIRFVFLKLDQTTAEKILLGMTTLVHTWASFSGIDSTSPP